MALAWLFTLPLAAVVGGLAAKVATSGNGGVLIVAVVALCAAATIYAYSRRSAVNAGSVNDTPAVPVVVQPTFAAAV
jgi:PiT family inorganic phosphate transporter